MKLEINTKVKPFRSEIVDRPWGYFGNYADNEPCTTKILYIKQGETLSLQYHLKRAQFYLLLSDKFVIQYSNVPVPLDIANMPPDDKKFKALDEFLNNHLITEEGTLGDMYGFHEYVIHRAKYIGKDEFGLALDVAFGENLEHDIFRVKDVYNREDIK